MEGLGNINNEFKKNSVTVKEYAYVEDQNNRVRMTMEDSKHILLLINTLLAI
jgi:hypothetical protein